MIKRLTLYLLILVAFFAGSLSVKEAKAQISYVPGCYVQGGTGTTASTNAFNCKTVGGNFFGIRAVNTSATLAFLRMYNLAAAPTCSSATGFVESIPIPASATGAGIVDVAQVPIKYSVGVSGCVTGGSTSTDNTNAPAAVFITLYVQ